MRAGGWGGWCALALAVLGPTASVVTAQEWPDSVVRSVDQFVEVHYQRLGLPGVAVSVATATEVLLAKGYGEGTVGGLPVSERTSFFLGSVTKTLTAFGIARLAEDGMVDLDDPVEAYLPDFSMRAPFEHGTLTLRHLLHHRSGLSQWDGHDGVAQEQGRFEHLSPAGPPGGGAEYSSLNFIVLGRVIEEASGMLYGEFLDQALFSPLGMRDTFTEGLGERIEPRAQGHRNVFGFNLEADEPSVPRFLVPAGFVSASALDMGRYTGMLLGGGSYGGARVADSTTVEGLLSSMDGSGPAMAWGRSRVDGTLRLGHSGNARTSAARVRLLPERGYAISVLVNTNSGPFFDSPDALLDGIQTILDGGSPPRLWPRERAFKGLLLAATLFSVIGMARHARDWGRAGYPISLNGRGRLGRLAVDVGGSAFLVLGLPRILGVPLPTMIEYLPDIGLGIAVSAGAGLVGGLLRSFTASSTVASPVSAGSE